MIRWALLALVAGGVSLAQAANPANRWDRLDVNEAAPPFVLTNQDGRRVALRDLRGKALVMTFFYSQCTDVCPLQLNALDALAGELDDSERGRVVLVGVSVDPVRDTPARLKAFIEERGLDGKRWQLLTGTLAEATRVAADYGVVVRPAPRGDFVHNTVYLLIDAKGIDRVEFHGIATPRVEVLRALRAIVAEGRPRSNGDRGRP